jgi:hypothetical protein
MAGELYMAARRSSRAIHTGATTSSLNEYFHGVNGAGLGASHQTGWTGLVARLIQTYGLLDAKQVLEGVRRTPLSVLLTPLEIGRG